jgi:CelD/BcsL family acetyltransferase involved in cellulose biosynthesis
MIICEPCRQTNESQKMSEPSQAILDGRGAHAYRSAVERHVHGPVALRPAVELTIHDDLAAVEDEWRRFESTADCTVFQCYDWLATWYRHIGRRSNVAPALVIGRRQGGELLFILPLAVTPGTVRRLTFLGGELGDYNAPLLAPDFSDRLAGPQFLAIWAEVCALLQRRPQHRHDLVELTKLPKFVGTQANPLAALDVRLNPSGAHLTHLRGTWEQYYESKRSSATRRRDRTKRKRLGEFGEVRFVRPEQPQEAERSIETLMEQKSRAFVRMGAANIFTPPGRREFFLDLAANPRLRDLVHVSRLDVGDLWAAINLGLNFRGTYYHVLASYDEGEASRFGPGAAHLRDLLAYAIGRGCHTFDFTIGDESYKSEWADRSLDLYDHVAHASARGWPAAALARGRSHLKRVIKHNPLLWAAASRLRTAVKAAVVRGKGVETPRP